jgi:hypothetical protein
MEQNITGLDEKDNRSSDRGSTKDPEPKILLTPTLQTAYNRNDVQTHINSNLVASSYDTAGSELCKFHQSMASPPVEDGAMLPQN